MKATHCMPLPTPPTTDSAHASGNVPARPMPK